MKRFSLVLVIFITLFFPHLSHGESVSSATTPFLRFYSEITPPFYWLDNNGVAQGINVDLANALFDTLDIEASIEHMPWARAYYEVEHHADVVLLSVLKTPARTSKLQWLGVVDVAEASLIRHKRRDDIEVSIWDDVYQYRVATIRGYGAADYLQQNGFEEGKNLVLVKSSKELWLALYTGRVDLVLSNYITGKYEVADSALNPDDIVSEFTVLPLNLEIQIATGLETPISHAQMIQKGLNTLKENGEYQRIMRKWGLAEQ